LNQVLFLCSANYYRSRFAEHLFNWLALRSDLPWRADSRGLLVGCWGDLRGISHYTVEALQRYGILLRGQHRNPQLLTISDLVQAQLVVAVKEAEHREMMAAQFPDWAERVEYWHVDDLDCAEPLDALPVLEQQVRALVNRLA